MEEMERNDRPEEPQEGKAKRVPGQDAYEWVQALVCSVLTVVMIFTFAVRLIGVDGHSMVPTLQDRDRLLVLSSLLYHDYKAGDIVVLRKESFDDKPIVKRVIAVEGQTVDIDFSTGSVTVDGVEHILHEGESILMPARHPHAVFGQERFKMLLVVVF